MTPPPTTSSTRTTTTRRTETTDLSVRDLKDITRDCAEALVDACRVALAVLSENLALLEQLESVTNSIDYELLTDEEEHLDRGDLIAAHLRHDAREAASTDAVHRPCTLRYDNRMTPEQCAELWACLHKENRDEEPHA